MTVRLNRRTPPADDATKAAKIARAGGLIDFIGTRRQCRQIHTLLVGEPGVTSYLGKGEGDLGRLLVYPEAGAGRETDRVF
jgi:hypothetical protein